MTRRHRGLCLLAQGGVAQPLQFVSRALANPERAAPEPKFEVELPEFLHEVFGAAGEALIVPVEPVAGQAVLDVADAHPHVLDVEARQPPPNCAAVAEHGFLVVLDIEGIHP